MATLGNYCLAPPKEFAFPKITNPDLQGLACKHVIRAMTMMQSASWSNVLGQEMARQARRTGYGDDRHTSAVFDGPTAKKLAQNRKTKVDKSKAQAAWKAYKKRQEAVAKRIKEGDADLADLRQKMGKVKKQNKQLKNENKALRDRAAELLLDQLKIQLRGYIDGAKVFGGTKAQAMERFAKDKGLSLETVKGWSM